MNTSAIAVSLSNDGDAVEAGKRYQSVPDMETERLRGLCVIDEDGEDYFYDAAMFCRLQVQPAVAQTLISFSKQG
ncbi:MAG: hypothetical protein IPN51_05940 [Chloracidobacterium sp.]|nr:hypothetical protein [Chloracidobacterium sp.]